MSVAAPEASPANPPPVRQGLARSVARHGSVYIVASALQALFAAITLPIAARFLPPGQYGLIALALIIALLFNVFAMAGLPTAAMRLYFDADAGPQFARRLYAPSTLIGLAFSVVGVLVLWALDLLGVLGPYWPSLVVVPVLTVPAVLGALSSNILQAEKRSSAFAIVAIMRGGVNTGCGILAVLLFKRDAMSYLAGYTFGSTLITVTAVLLAHPTLGFPSRELMRRALRIGLPVISASVGVVALAMADRFVVQVARSQADVGRYQLAYAVGGLVFSVLVSVNFAWLPEVMSAGSDEARAATIRHLGVTLQGLAMILVAGVSLTAPFVLPAVLASSYHPRAMASLASVIALGAITYVPYMASSQLLLWNERTGPMGKITPAAVLVEVAVGAALVGPLGLTGVAIGSGIAFVAQACMAIAAASRIATIEWLTPAWLIASIPGTAGWVLGMVLPNDAAGICARLAVVALLLAGFALTGLRVLRSGAARRSAQPAAQGGAAPSS